MLIIDVAGRRLVLLAAGHAIRIDPGVQLHAALVGLLYHELQRVPHGIRGFARLAREPSRPGLNVTDICRIGLGSNLPDDGIASRLSQQVELLDEILPRLLGIHLGILALSDNVHPGTTELMFGQRPARGDIVGSRQTTCQRQYKHR